MFLIPKNSLKKFDAERSCFVLNEFAAAEFSSALEMLFAAKNVGNKKLSIGFIRHALDEYKHCSIFTTIKNQIILEYNINKIWNIISCIIMEYSPFQWRESGEDEATK